MMAVMGRRSARGKRRRGVRSDAPDVGIRPLSQTAEYALRAMTHLAIQERVAVRASDLSEATQVPVHYLSKVMRRLVAAGLLVSQKGHGGGFMLARSPEKIRFVDVLDAVGEGPGREQCAFGWGACDARHPCPMHDAWSRLNQTLSDWAHATRLSDVVPKVTRLPRG